MESMNITGALRKIARLRGMIAELDTNIAASACYEEDKPPPFEFQALVKERCKLVDEMVEIKERLAIANCKTFHHAGATYTGALAIRKLDEYKALIALFTKLPIRDRVRDVEKVRETSWDDDLEKSVTRTTEKVWISALGKKDLQNIVASARDEFDALNMALEKFNHETNV